MAKPGYQEGRPSDGKSGAPAPPAGSWGVVQDLLAQCGHRGPTGLGEQLHSRGQLPGTPLCGSVPGSRWAALVWTPQYTDTVSPG